MLIKNTWNWDWDRRDSILNKVKEEVEDDNEDQKDTESKIDEFKDLVTERFGKADQQIHEIETNICEILDKVKEVIFIDEDKDLDKITDHINELTEDLKKHDD